MLPTTNGHIENAKHRKYFKEIEEIGFNIPQVETKLKILKWKKVNSENKI